MARALAHEIRGKMSREAIIAAAEDVFGEYGYNNASLAMISARVGMTQAGLLHHFGSKEALLRTVLDAHVPEDDRLCESLLHANSDPLETYLAAFEASLRDNRWTRLLAVLMGESVLIDHPARSYVRDRDDNLRAALIASLKTSASAEQVSMAAGVLVAMSQGLRMQVLVNDNLDVTAALRIIIDGSVRPLLN